MAARKQTKIEMYFPGTPRLSSWEEGSSPLVDAEGAACCAVSTSPVALTIEGALFQCAVRLAGSTSPEVSADVGTYPSGNWALMFTVGLSPLVLAPSVIPAKIIDVWDVKEKPASLVVRNCESDDPS